MDIAAAAVVVGMLPILFMSQLPTWQMLLGLATLMVGLWRQTSSALCQTMAWALCVAGIGVLERKRRHAADRHPQRKNRRGSRYRQQRETDRQRTGQNSVQD
ncbi:hypothetical protein [Serratia odorifera]|uniref:hypothetical protein n=1 Tax=Serratia odorifera TaxID=618 RepID=UPI001F53F871